jgi:alpha-glucosidase
MLSDNPTNYMKEPDCLSFLAKVPVTWDETRCVNASIGQYVTVARKKGDEWYIGSMTGFAARSFDVPLGFLDEGKYTVTIFRDGANADRRAEDYAMDTIEVDSKSILTLKLAAGGGFVCRFTKL